MVLAAHAFLVAGFAEARTSTSANVLSGLALGVWLFFAVSGFLIAGPFLRALIDGRSLPMVRRYAFRRAARILPAYWVAFAAVLLIATGVAWWQVPVHGLLLHSLFPNEAQKVFFVAWTLGIEAIFYALVPLVALLAWRLTRGRPVSRERVMAAIAGIWLLTVVWSLFVAAAFPFQQGGAPAGGLLLLPNPLGNFCPGMLVFLAETAPEGRRVWQRAYRALAARPTVTLGVGVALFVLAQATPFETSPTAFALLHPLTGIASGLVLVGLLHAAWVVPLARVLAPAGLISYGIYLWHWVVVMFLDRAGITLIDGYSAAATVAHVAILLALTVPLALASWLLVERPLMLRTTLWDRRRRSEPEAGAPGLLAEPVPAPR